MEQLFFHQLTQLSHQKLNLLYQDKASVICIFRTLQAVAQDLVYRLLGIGDCEIAQGMIVKWTATLQQARQKMDSSFKILKRAKILIPSEDNPKAFLLNQYFQNTLQEVLKSAGGSVLKFRLSKSKSINLGQIKLEAEKKWKNILNAMLGLISPRELPQKTLGLLVRSKLLKGSKGSNCEITPDGFKFVMRKPEEQVSTLVMKYIELSYEFDRDIVEIYQTIFALTLTRYQDLYKSDAQSSLQILEDFNDLGLITIISRGSYTLFKISHLLSQFLGVKQAEQQEEEGKGLGSVDRNERFLIVQTNFKVFAYTESRLFLAILSLFVNIEMKLPNLVIGALTHKSVRNAFLRGIKAKDISSFLDARSILQKGYAFESPSKIAFLDSKEAKRNVPNAVVQQLSLWEDDLERFKMKPGIMISDFKDEANYRKCQDNFNSRNLIEHSSDKSKIIILKPHAEGYAHDFIMKL